MAANPTNEVLANMIENLTKTTEEGFKGTHHRHDEQNGKVEKNTVHRLKTEDVINELAADKKRKYNKYTDLMWKVAIAALALIFGIDKFI